MPAACAAGMLLLAGCSSAPTTLPTLEQYPQASSPAPAPSEAPSPGVVTQPLEDSGVAVEERVATAPPAAPSASPPAAAQSQQAPAPTATGEANAAAATTAPPAAIGPLTLDSAAAVPAAGQQEFERAVALAQSGDLAGAERAFESLGAQYPQYATPLVNVAILRAKAGNLEAAEQMLQSAIVRNPDSAPAFNQLGIVYRRLGRFKDADTAYQRAVALDPNYANAYLNLGVLCDLYLQQPQRALQAFERYLELLGKPDPKVSGWLSELKVRAARSSARSEQ